MSKWLPAARLEEMRSSPLQGDRIAAWEYMQQFAERQRETITNAYNRESRKFVHLQREVNDWESRLIDYLGETHIVGLHLVSHRRSGERPIDDERIVRERAAAIYMPTSKEFDDMASQMAEVQIQRMHNFVWVLSEPDVYDARHMGLYLVGPGLSGVYGSEVRLSMSNAALEKLEGKPEWIRWILDEWQEKLSEIFEFALGTKGRY